MTQLIKTLPMLLAQAPDNTLRLITPQRYRDSLVSLWGVIATRDPTTNDDNANTSGVGYCDVGSKWINPTGSTIWECFDGTATAAVWVKIYPPAAPPAAPPNAVGVVDYGPFTPTSFPPSGLIPTGSGPLPDGTTTLIDGAGMYSGPWVTHTGLWTRPPWYASGQLLYAGVVLILSSSLGVGWENERMWFSQSDTSWTVDVSPGPLWLQPYNGAVALTPLDSTIIVSGTLLGPIPSHISADPLGFIKVGTLMTSNLPASFGPGGITFTPVTLGSTPYTIEVDTITGNVYYLDAGGTPQQIQTGGGSAGTLKHASGTTTSSWVTILQSSGLSNGVLGSWGIHNTGSTAMSYRLIMTDAEGNTATATPPDLNGHGETGEEWWDTWKGTAFGEIPLASFQLQVQIPSGGSSTTFDAWSQSAT